MKCLAIAILLLALTAGPIPAATSEPFVIPVILSLSGAGAFLGHADETTLEAAEELINRDGGIKGQAVHFIYQDDQSSPQLAVQLANQVIAGGFPVMLGPSGSATCSAVLPIVNRSGPVAYCLSPSLHAPANSFSFSTSMAVHESVRGALRYITQRGWHRVALLTATDSTGQDGEQGLHDNLTQPEFKQLLLVDTEHFNTTDVSVGAQIARIRATDPDVLIAWTTGTPFGLVLRQLRQSGFSIPVMSNSGNAITAQIAQYVDYLPKELYFSSMVGLGVEVMHRGPVLNALRRFNAALNAKGIVPDNGYIFAWDPSFILVDALRHVGATAGASRVKAYIEGLHDYAGINGIYDFRDGSQRGLGINTALIVRWDPATKRWIPVTGPGGSRI